MKAIYFAIVAAIYLPAAVHSADSPNPPAKKPKWKLAPDPNAVTARVKAGPQSWDLKANALGSFRKVIIEQKRPVKVTMLYPESLAGQMTVIVLRGGGTLDHGLKIRRERLDKHGRLDFTYHFGSVEHFQYVEVRVGAKKKHHFEFHVDH